MSGMGFLNEGYKPSSWDKDEQKDDTGPHFNGIGLNNGPIDLALQPNEGFALLHCGGTAVKIGFTSLQQICFLLGAGSHAYGGPGNDEILRAFYGVACEASMGNAPITSSYSEHELKVAKEKLARVQAAFDALAEAIKS
jgi:hypothetical protein